MMAHTEGHSGIVRLEPPAEEPGSGALLTRRLCLLPITLPMVEAVLLGDRAAAEDLAHARLPQSWPGARMIHQGFGASLDDIRRDPPSRLWGDRLLVARSEDPSETPIVVGSVVFHGRPGADGVAEVGYGVADEFQGLGLATEGTRAVVAWALARPEVTAVTATTFGWHRASLRVIDKLGMSLWDTRDHEVLGELLVYGRTRDGSRRPAAFG